jgi:outer membrane immunogenic protein
MKVVSQLTKFAAGAAIVAGTAVASISVAQADGMPSRGRAVVYEQPQNWGGFYFGAQAGWAWADIDSTFVNAAGTSLGLSDSTDHGTAIYGGQIGLQHQFGNIVLGVEAGVASAFQNDDGGDVSCPNPARTCTKRFDDVLTIGGRLGWAMGKWMPYLAGGYANGAFAHKSYVTGTGASPLFGRERTGGLYVGGGLDMALAQGWTIGLEYRHYEFNDVLMPTYDNQGVLSGEFRNIDPTVDTVAVRVSWKFGRQETRPLK